MEGRRDHATLDSGSPMDIGGETWIVDYLKNQNIDVNELNKEYQRCISFCCWRKMAYIICD